MAELKTKKTGESVEAFTNAIVDANRRNDCISVIALMQKHTSAKSKMWGTGIVGFGDVQLKYESGRELDWFICGLASRKNALVLYGLAITDSTQQSLLNKLGKCQTGKGCLYIKSLNDIDTNVLSKLIEQAVALQKKNSV